MIKYKEKIININTLIDELTEVIQDVVFTATENGNYISIDDFKTSLEYMYKAIEQKTELIECKEGETKEDYKTFLIDNIVEKEKEIKELKNMLDEWDQVM